MRGGLLLVILSVHQGPVFAQINVDAYRDYFLVGQFGEVCTMCEIVVLCQHGSDVPEQQTVPAGGTFTLYHIQTRTFWSQMSTIWEWFITNFTSDRLAARGHTRPVHVYAVVDGEWPAKDTIEARLILEPGVLEFGAHEIDRVDRAWRNAQDKAVVGYCTRLSLWEALESIDANAPGASQ